MKNINSKQWWRDVIRRNEEKIDRTTSSEAAEVKRQAVRQTGVTARKRRRKSTNHEQRATESKKRRRIDMVSKVEVKFEFTRSQGGDCSIIREITFAPASCPNFFSLLLNFT
jgi:hypothetical protein